MVRLVGLVWRTRRDEGAGRAGRSEGAGQAGVGGSWFEADPVGGFFYAAAGYCLA
jgi:hypothetical protein